MPHTTIPTQIRQELGKETELKWLSQLTEKQEKNIKHKVCKWIFFVQITWTKFTFVQFTPNNKTSLETSLLHISTGVDRYDPKFNNLSGKNSLIKLPNWKNKERKCFPNL